MSAQTESHNVSQRALRLPEVCERVAMSRATVLRLVSQGKFPSPIRPSARVTAWLESDINAFLARQRDAADKGISDAPAGETPRPEIRAA